MFWILLLFGVLWVGSRLLPESSPEGLLEREYSTPRASFLILGNTFGVLVSPLPEIETFIWESSRKWGIDYSVLYDLAVCESQLRTDAWGDHGLAYGLYQWHFISWVMYNKMYNTELNILLPQDQIELTARVLKDGGENNWMNCWSKIN